MVELKPLFISPYQYRCPTVPGAITRLDHSHVHLKAEACTEDHSQHGVVLPEDGAIIQMAC